jgi:ACS family tartrate transporter-like MFS transporter
MSGGCVICWAVTNPAATHHDLSERTRSRVTRRLLPFLFLLYVVNYIDRNNVGFAGLLMTKELRFSDAVFGFGSGVFFLGYMLLGIPGAMLVEKWSARKVLAGTMVLWGCVASSTGFIHTAHQFYGMRFTLGLTEAAFFPGMITYLGHWFRPQDRAKAVAGFMAAIPLSQAIAAPLSAGLMKVTWGGLSGWRWLLILEGVPAVLAGIAAWFYLTDWPAQARWLDPEERGWLAAELESAHHRAEATGRVTLAGAFSHPDVLLLCAAYFGGTAGNYGLNLWMPKMLQRLGGLTAVRTALLSAIPALAAIPAMLLCGWHSDRTGERRWHTAAPRLIAAVAMACVTISAISVPAALALFAVASAGIVAAYPPLWAIPTGFLSKATAAASIGLISSFGNLGGFAGPYLVGWFSSRTGSYLGGLWSMAGFLALSGVFVLMIRVRQRPAPQ